MTYAGPKSERPPDPMGFRVMRERWHKLADSLDMPIPDDEERATQLRALALNFEQMMADPAMRQRLAREHAWRLEQLIAWSAKRPW